VRGRLPAIEQSGFGEVGDARADTGNVCALRRLLSQSGQERAMARELAVEIEAAGGDDDDVGVPEPADRDLRQELERIGLWTAWPSSEAMLTRKAGFAGAPLRVVHNRPAL
jgi:hypothetical protein